MPTSPINVDKLEKLAEVAIQVGLGLKPGQDLYMTSPTSALPLARLIAEQAYKAGAGLVTTLFSDEEMTLARYRYGQDASFDRGPGWLYDGVAKAFEENTARLAIAGDNPMLLAGQDPEKVSRANRALSKAYKPAQSKIVNFDINWTVVPYPGAAWARQVFQDDDEDAAVGKLAEAIFAATRISTVDPIAAWAEHNARLMERQTWLTSKNFSALKYMGPGTDLTLGLAEGHAWKGGASTSRNGITCNPNIPTEEVFTTPDPERVDGHVSATMPLELYGSYIDGIRIEFDGGRAVKIDADQGADALRAAAGRDDGASRLGEIALVDKEGRIGPLGTVFYETLLDENAASHIALGNAYTFPVEDAADRERVNKSDIHVDFMIGSNEVDVDGITGDGDRVPVLRGGSWQI